MPQALFSSLISLLNADCQAQGAKVCSDAEHPLHHDFRYIKDSWLETWGTSCFTQFEPTKFPQTKSMTRWPYQPQLSSL